MLAAALPAASEARALLNAWQRDLPLVAKPYDALGAAHGLSGAQVRAVLQGALDGGQASRIGGVFGVGAGGAGMLCALRVPAGELERVARIVDAEPGVNHNYARDHALNLWFVATATDDERLQASVDRIERATGLAALRLPMRRAYRIDLGFDLDGADDAAPQAALPVAPVSDALRPLAARLEEGLALVERPFAALGEPLGLTEAEVIAALAEWCERGTLRRLGVVLRHHEFGISANAMTVFELPESEVDAAGERLAAQPGVTLCYRRDSAPGWPYTLYCMVHGRERGAVRALIDAAVRHAGLADRRHEVLFSTRRFKQTGARYFSEPAS
ncbi:MAG: Lrp/AsnC family transcriptional regulator [Burkholderiaceae bacterium]|nr:Lrp/AsnC family transcriptional regulator [Burkholderiaceae bacterium]